MYRALIGRIRVRLRHFRSVNTTKDGAALICYADRFEALLGFGVRRVWQNHELTTKDRLDRRG